MKQVNEKVLPELDDELVSHRARVPRARADERLLDLVYELPGAELDHRVPLRLAVRRDEVDDDRVARLCRPLDGHELRDRLAQRLELPRHELLGNLGIGLRHLEPDPVDDVHLRLDVDGGGEAPGGLVVGRQLVVVLRLRDRPDARAGGRVPEPAADVAVDGLREDPLLAEPLHEDRDRHLAGAEAGDLDGAREVGRGVLHRVVHVVRGDVDRQPDAIPLELLDPGLHSPIQAEAFRARPALSWPVRGRGGTGRRAGFRSRWASALGGSTPLARTSSGASAAVAAAARLTP